MWTLHVLLVYVVRIRCVCFKPLGLTKRSDQLAAGPFFMELTEILLDDDAGRPIIEVCQKFGFPLPGADVHLFVSCEKRQWQKN